ncbi:hypothetical protein ACH24_00750 [Francisella persica ATCC VR-331]|uniref:RNA helicase HrpA C-terminal domain-containing protein n=1 Tax=Francisella persica ATCC VR-331 TaxID=1086726 RepID=A0AAC8VD05_9GAMM|nr:DUF3418 domain-containing protein [Francisella persica]ALB01346.1 hypothetical protein ACH24_00750 [Francisella persica ATCC VR-331]
MINGNFDYKAYIYQQNLKLINQVEDLENKSRRRDILVGEEILFEHYDDFIPDDVCDGVTFDKWKDFLQRAAKFCF